MAVGCGLLIAGCGPDREAAVSAVKSAGGRVGIDDAGVVWSVHLTQTDSASDCLEHLRAFPELTYLSLSGTPVSAADVRVVGTLTALRKLYLDETGLDDAAAEELRSLSNLKVLDVSGTGLTVDGVTTLASLPALEYCRVTGLDLSADEIRTLRQVFPLIDFHQ